MTTTATDPRVAAIRADAKVGTGTCSTFDECMTDQEIQDFLDDREVKTPKRAVTVARATWALQQDVWADRGGF